MLRLLPYLIGNNIPHDDKHWQNYLQMLEIVDHLLAPEITEDEVGHLTVLIQHHINYSQLYSSSMVMPKHHFMTHMPRLILKHNNGTICSQCNHVCILN